MYISEDLQKELDFFKRTNEHFKIEAGKSSTEVKNATNELLYMGHVSFTCHGLLGGWFL